MTVRTKRFGKIFLKSLSVYSAVLLVGAVALAQGTPGSNPSGSPGGRVGAVSHTIRGKLFLPSGTPPEQRIRVVLEVSTGGIASETFSDSVGNFEFRSLPNGVYKVTVPTDNRIYDTTQETVELFGTFSRTVTTQVYLKDKNPDLVLKAKEKLLSPADIQEIPKDAKKAYEKGLKQLNENKSEEAIKSFDQALKIFPDYLHALNKLGEQKAQKNDFGEAQTAFEKAISINQKFALPYINLGILHFNQKRFDEAIAALEQGNNIDGSYPVGHLYLGRAFLYREKPDLDRSEKALIRAGELGRGNLAVAHLDLFNLYYRRRNLDKAAAQLEAYLKEAPNAPNAQDVRQTLAKLKKIVAEQAGAPKN
jgi:Tfp pilus assembly protein PilF